MSCLGLTVHSRFLKLPMQFCWFFLGFLVILLGAFSVCDLTKCLSLHPEGHFHCYKMISPTI